MSIPVPLTSLSPETECHAERLPVPLDQAMLCVNAKLPCGSWRGADNLVPDKSARLHHSPGASAGVLHST